MRRHLPATFALLALSACDDKPAAPPASTAATAPPSAASAPPASTGADAGAAAPKPTVARDGEPGALGGFHIVAEGSPINIYPMGAAAVVDTGAFYAVLGAGSLEQDPQLFRVSDEQGGRVQITEAARFTHFFGAWPDQAWAMGKDVLVKRVNDVWTKVELLREGEQMVDIAPWEKKRAVAAIRMAQPDLRFTLAGSSAGGVVPAPGKPTAEQEGCAVRMDPAVAIKLSGLPSGHLFAVGRECKTGKAVAERWAPGKVRGEAAVIEGVMGAPTALVAVSADEAYAMFADGQAGYVATWDGKAWKPEKAPFGVAKSAFASGDGAAWALGEEALYVHHRGGTWARVEMGAGKPTSAWAKDEKTVWVVTDAKLLLRSGPISGETLKLSPASAVWPVVDRDKRWPATAACKRVFVMIARLGSVDKAPTTYPALTEAVKGNAELTAKEITYLVEEVGTTLWVGAKVPNTTLAEKLVAALKVKTPKSEPMVVCHEPAVVKGALKVE